MAKILLVEDDAAVARSVCQWLEAERHTIELAVDGKQADELLSAFSYDLVILDWGLPGMDGVDILSRLRSRGGSVPVIMMTGKSQTESKLAALDGGADDYITKPVDVRELSARIRALLRRPAALAPSVFTVADLMLDPAAFSVTKKGKPIQLTNREYALLEFLARHAGQYFTTETLLERVWSSDVDASPLTVRVHVKRLRDKIDSADEESLIENNKGLGYRLRTG